MFTHSLCAKELVFFKAYFKSCQHDQFLVHMLLIILITQKNKSGCIFLINLCKLNNISSSSFVLFEVEKNIETKIKTLSYYFFTLTNVFELTTFYRSEFLLWFLKTNRKCLTIYLLSKYQNLQSHLPFAWNYDEKNNGSSSTNLFLSPSLKLNAFCDEYITFTPQGFLVADW